MEESTVNEFSSLVKSAMNIISKLLEIILTAAKLNLERRHSKKEKAQSSNKKSLPKKLFDKIATKSGEVDLKKFVKLCQKKDYKTVEIASKIMPEVADLAKKAKIPFVYCNNDGSNMTAVAVPAEYMESFNMLIKMTIDKTCRQNPDAFEIISTAELNDVQKKILHDLAASYDIPATTFNSTDNGIKTFIPKEYAEQYKNIIAEAKEMYNEISDVEITDLTEEFPWDDISTMVIEVTPHQAKLLEEHYRSEIKIVDIGNGKLYALGSDNLKEGVNEIISSDKQDELAANDWDLAVVDKTILMNKNALLESETDLSCTMRIPGTSHYITFHKNELAKIDNGKTYSYKIDYNQKYELTDKDGTSAGFISGAELAKHFNTRSPFFKMLNDNTDKTRYNNSSLDRIELFCPIENKLISFPITNADELKRNMIRVGISQNIAEKLVERIAEKLSSDYLNDFNLKENKAINIYQSSSIVNEVKQVLFAQKTAEAACVENNTNELGEKFAIYDPSKKMYVLLDKQSNREDIENALKSMGYKSIERAAIISKFSQQYNINGELMHSENKVQGISTSNPDLKGIAFNDLGNNNTVIFNADEENGTLKYIVVDNHTDTVELEQLCKTSLGILDAYSIAELAQCFKDKLAATKVMVSGKNLRTDGQNYSISQLTSRFMEIKQESTGKATIVSKDDVKAEKLSSAFGIKPESAKKLAATIEKSFRTAKNTEKKFSLNKLKNYADKKFNQNKSKDISNEAVVKETTRTERSI